MGIIIIQQRKRNDGRVICHLLLCSVKFLRSRVKISTSDFFVAASLSYSTINVVKIRKLGQNVGVVCVLRRVWILLITCLKLSIFRYDSLSIIFCSHLLFLGCHFIPNRTLKHEKKMKRMKKRRRRVKECKVYQQSEICCVFMYVKLKFLSPLPKAVRSTWN